MQEHVKVETIVPMDSTDVRLQKVEAEFAEHLMPLTPTRVKVTEGAQQGSW